MSKNKLDWFSVIVLCLCFLIIKHFWDQRLWWYLAITLIISFYISYTRDAFIAPEE